MDNFWTESATKLQTEMAAADVELSAADDVIVAHAGDWFTAMSRNAQGSVIATMRNLASA